MTPLQPVPYTLVRRNEHGRVISLTLLRLVPVRMQAGAYRRAGAT